MQQALPSTTAPAAAAAWRRRRRRRGGRRLSRRRAALHCLGKPPQLDQHLQDEGVAPCPLWYIRELKMRVGWGGGGVRCCMWTSSTKGQRPGSGVDGCRPQAVDRASPQTAAGSDSITGTQQCVPHSTHPCLGECHLGRGLHLHQSRHLPCQRLRGIQPSKHRILERYLWAGRWVGRRSTAIICPPVAIVADPTLRRKAQECKPRW